MFKQQMEERLNLKFLSSLESKGTKNVLYFCMKMNLIACEYECPTCKLSMKLSPRNDLNDGFTWCCQVKGGENAHAVKRSVRSGSWFEVSKLSISELLKIAYLWIKRTKLVWIIDELNVSKNTVTDWVRYCREVCVEAIVTESVALGGPGMTVIIEESKFFKPKSKKGKRVKGEWVYWGVEKETNKCFVAVCQNRGKTDLLSVLNKYVLPGTVIISTCWKTHDCFSDEDFMCLTENKSLTFKDPDTGSEANSIKDLWNCNKHLTHHAEKFDPYLAELLWRRFHSEDYQSLFKSLLNTISQVYTPRIKDDPPLSKKRSSDEPNLPAKH